MSDDPRLTKILNLKMGEGSWITVDLTLIKEKLDKRILDLGYMTQEELDEQWENSDFKFLLAKGVRDGTG